MLCTESVDIRTLDILRQIMQMPAFEYFSLAGGTSLALQIGHRISVDLDFFGNHPINKEETFDLLSTFGALKLITHTNNILIFELNGIKIDFVNYRYNLLMPLVKVDNIRLYHKADIAAMKLAAIAGRGKKRDFIDLFFLLNEYSMKEMINFYNQKYPDGSEFLVIKSLTYFDDAEQDISPAILKTIQWEEVKSKIVSEVKQY
ncbi:MAG: nucleotidyl transferase AbiEii/AbiGii toxin family protein [Bacteroidetes bacterium]|nr:nucleotidyl transferase AbiEii/AbiGii toxin family protein [Bacteroidota bacterium]